MIIEPVDDLNIGAIFKAPMGELRFPGLIGLHRFKAGDVCLRAFGRAGGHQTCSVKDDDLRKGIRNRPLKHPEVSPMSRHIPYPHGIPLGVAPH